MCVGSLCIDSSREPNVLLPDQEIWLTVTHLLVTSYLGLLLYMGLTLKTIQKQQPGQNEAVQNVDRFYFYPSNESVA